MHVYILQYLEKTVETVKPYTDAVVAKAEGIIHEFQGDSMTKPVTTTERDVTGSTTGVAEGHNDLAATAEKAKVLLNQGLGAVSVSARYPGKPIYNRQLNFSFFLIRMLSTK